MSFESTGGSGNATASDANSISVSERTNPVRAGITVLVTGLSAGAHTFTALYRTFDGSSSCTLTNRTITVVPLP
jgi:hypothetical protein